MQASVTRMASVITGVLKSKIDGVWDTFWSSGIINPLEVIERITHLLVLRSLAPEARAFVGEL